MPHEQTLGRACALANNLEAQLRIALNTLSALSGQAEEIKVIAAEHERGDLGNDWDVDTFLAHPELDLALCTEGNHFKVLCRGQDITALVSNAVLQEAKEEADYELNCDNASPPYLLPGQRVPDFIKERTEAEVTAGLARVRAAQ